MELEAETRTEDCKIVHCRISIEKRGVKNDNNRAMEASSQRR